MDSLDPQPGQRPPAPGQLALVQAFLNTHFDLSETWGEEVLHSPQALGRWLSERELLTAGPAPSERDRLRALSLRAALRHAAGGVIDGLAQHAGGLPAAVTFAADGPAFVPGPGGGVTGALGALVAIAATAMLDGSWSRLKICPGEHCGWAFYDASRNRSGRWCSMSVCGGRTKARAHYRRSRRPGEDPQ